MKEATKRAIFRWIHIVTPHVGGMLPTDLNLLPRGKPPESNDHRRFVRNLDQTFGG
jgi:hypothetical protein